MIMMKFKISSAGFLFLIMGGFLFQIGFFGISNSYGYVSNSSKCGALTVLMNKPDSLTEWNHPVRVVTVFKNGSDKKREVTLKYSTLAPLEFSLSKEESKQIFRAKITIPSQGTAEHSVTITAQEGAFSAHYPINLAASFCDDKGCVKTVDVVYPVETKLPLNKNWKISLPVEKKCVPWRSDRDAFSNGQELKFDLNKTSSNSGAGASENAVNRASIQLGRLGFADALISFQFNGEKAAVRGLRIWLDGQPLYDCQPGPLVWVKEKNVWTQKARAAERDLTLVWSIRQDNGALRLAVDCDVPELISKVEFGPWDQRLENICFGHGFLVHRPSSFSISADSHSFSTSYAGFDFENGFSLTMATSLVPESLNVIHKEKRYSIAVAGATMMTLVPGNKKLGGAFNCAVRYRKIFEKPAAAGVRAKAGRFVVDIWNGRFNEHSRLIKDAAERYGLKNDLIFLSHNWQKNRYDHRLPDVWPPNPAFGSKEEMLDVMKTARKYGWYFGIHHNVIDYYPDAPMFQFENVAFDAKGVPQKAYRNVFLDAQSYRLAPHRAADVLAESLRQMDHDGFLINCCFVDVLSSGASYVCRPYYDLNGKAYAQNSASEGIKRVYSIIRDVQKPILEKKYGKNAPGTQPFSISEGGHDFTLGDIDGADCQFMNIVKKSGENNWFQITGYEDAEKIPWFDAVNHQKYILHGVGYSIRYESGRGRELHGLESDDYICAELLTGHSLMVDAWTRDVRNVLSAIVLPIDHEQSLRQMVRMYYLAQPVMRELAHNDIEKLEFFEGNIHRYIVHWTGGTTVYINRDEKDWMVGKTVLPQYGYLAKNEKLGLESKIHRLFGRVVEESVWREKEKTFRYVNARNLFDAKILPVAPEARMTDSNGKSLRIHIDWKIFEGHSVAKDDFQISIFLVRRKGSETATGNDFLLKTVQQKFSSSLETELSLPEGVNGKYDLLLAVVPVGKNIEDRYERMKLLATPSFFQRYHLGEVVLTKGQKPSFTRFEETDNSELYQRLFPPKDPIDFGFCRTKGAFRLEYSKGKTDPVILQLPGEPQTEFILK